MRRHRDDPPIVLAIPDDNAPVPPAHRPTWWTVRTVRAIGFVFVGLAVAMSLLSAYISWSTAVDSARQSAAVERRLAVLEADLAERTRQRDLERDAAAARDAATRAELGALLCELLSQLPAESPNLDRLRATLRCAQPGLAADPSGGPPTTGDGTEPPGEAPATTGATAPPPLVLGSPTAEPDAPAAPPPPPDEPAPGLACTLLPVVC